MFDSLLTMQAFLFYSTRCSTAYILLAYSPEWDAINAYQLDHSLPSLPSFLRSRENTSSRKIRTQNYALIWLGKLLPRPYTAISQHPTLPHSTYAFHEQYIGSKVWRVVGLYCEDGIMHNGLKGWNFCFCIDLHLGVNSSQCPNFSSKAYFLNTN